MRTAIHRWILATLVAVAAGGLVAAEGDARTTVTIGMKELPLSFDYGYDWSEAGVWLQSNVGDCLIWRDRETADYVPWLAEGRERLDATTWRIALRAGVSFTNGEPFDADAAAFWFDRIRNDPQMLPHRQWDFVETVEVVDALTIDVRTVEPEPAFLNKMAGTGCQVVPPVYTTEVGPEGFGQRPIWRDAFHV
jgi:peptide/nickel transport system substrate-binding protein